MVPYTFAALVYLNNEESGLKILKSQGVTFPMASVKQATKNGLPVEENQEKTISIL